MVTTIALTNDDGIDAPGIEALHRAIATLVDDSTIATVAPDQHLSGCSHQINRGGPIAVTPQGEQSRHAIGGTPADCTRVAHHLYPQLGWILSGINDGGNLGADIYVSGTVAAAREAALLRLPAIAISHYKARGFAIDWGVTAQRAARVLALLMDPLAQAPLAQGEFWNVNLPSVAASAPDPEIVFCPICTQPLPTAATLEAGHFRYTGAYQDRQRDPGADVDVCFSGKISISKVSLW